MCDVSDILLLFVLCWGAWYLIPPLYCFRSANMRFLRKASWWQNWKTRREKSVRCWTTSTRSQRQPRQHRGRLTNSRVPRPKLRISQMTLLSLKRKVEKALTTNNDQLSKELSSLYSFVRLISSPQGSSRLLLMSSILYFSWCRNYFKAVKVRLSVIIWSFGRK